MKPLNRASAFIISISLIVMTGCVATSTRESTGQYIDDSSITTRVKSAIIQDASLKSLEINVETFKGQVQLSGFVSTQENIDKAVTITQDITGVLSVKNNMQLK